MDAVIRDSIDTSQVVAAVSDAGFGGMVLFLGTVRRGTEDGAVTAIEYSAYEEMVRSECERLLAEAGSRWPEAKCVLQHRVGLVPAGEPSIVAAVGAPHRREAFEACRFLIDEAKQRLPVWKKERFDDGTSRWRESDTLAEPRR